MITQRHRFHGYNSLNNAYRHGKTLRGSNITLRYSVNPKRSSYRAAVVVSKKVAKSAVVRNRIRRRIFEVVRRNNELITTPYDFIFTVYGADFATMPADQLESSITKLLSAAKPA